MNKFLCLEGTDGVGKSTQVKLLSKYMTKYNIDHITTREPGGSPFGEKIRELLLTEKNLSSKERAYLFFAIRSKHIRDIIKPALSKGKYVICDRFYFSTYVYQNDYISELRPEIIDFLLTDSCNKVYPDVTIYLDSDVSVCLERLKKRNKFNILDSIEERDIIYKKSLFNYVLQEHNNSAHTIKIKSNGSEEKVHKRIIEELKERKLI
jgi:dTMP kinase